MYTFTKDKTTIRVEGGAAVDAVKDVTITADGNELDLTGGEAGIRAAAGKTVDITAGTLKVNGKTGIDAAGTVTLKGKSEITGTEKAVNVQKGGSVTLGTSTISGDVENSGHLTLDAATTVSGSIANAGVLAVNGETHAKDLTTTGTMTVGTDGVLAADNINVNGGTFTANGSVSSTVKADKGGKVILKGKKTVLKGLVSGDHSSIEAILSGKDSALNGSFDGAGSVTLSLADQANWTGNAVGNGAYAVTIGKGSTWTGSSAGNNTSLTLGGTWNNRGTSSLKQMAGNGGIIDMTDAKAGTVTIQSYGGSSTYIYKHDTTKPADANSGYAILGGDVKISQADKGSEITLLTDRAGLDFDSAKADEKNLISGTLNALAGKLYYTGYADGNLSGTVKIAEGLTASSASLRSETITFSTADTGTKKAGQGFYAYTPEQEKPNYKTGAITKSEDISLSRELDESGVAHVSVTESNAGGDKFASALYAGESTDPSSPMTVKMSGKGLALNAAQSSGQAAAIYAGANTYIKVINLSADQKLAITASNTDTRASHGIYALGNAHLNISGPVEITDVITQGDAATGINIQGQQSEITIDGPLTISNVKGLRERGAGMSAAGIQVTGESSTVTVSGPVDISGVRGSGIKLVGANTKVSVGGGTITAVEDSDHSHNFYAVRVDKGALDINMKDGAAGDTTTKITGDMYATGQYGKKVVEYSGGELIDWNDAGILNVALTNKDSFWKGVAAYDQYNDDYGAGGNTMHDIGQFNLYLQNGATWTNEQQSHVTTTTIAYKNPVWEGSTLATLHGGKDADNAGLIYQKDTNPISVVNYSGHTTVFYDHDADHPTNILGGSFTIGQANTGSNITLITDNQGITKGFNAYDKAEDQNTVNEVLNKLAQKLFYTANDGKLAGTVKIAEGLTASSIALKTGDISFSTDATGTKTPGQGFYEYTAKDDSVITDPITGNLDKKYENLGIETEKGIYNFTQDTVIDVTKGDYSSNLSAIESSGGPITINADGKNLDVSYHVLKGSNVARAVATGLSYGKSKDVTITAKSLKLSTDTTGFYSQGVYATGGKITIDADTTISTSAQTESNGIYSGNGGTVIMSGNLTIQKDSKAANYIALKSDDNGVINVNMKDGKEGAGIVKIDGDVYTKSAETYDYWEDETTSTSSTVNLALQGKDGSWNGRSLYEVTSGDDSTSYGTFNLWLTDGATWTNEKNGKEVPSGFTGSRVTKFTGGSDAAHAGNIFQNDTKNITIDNYSGNTNIFYAHTGNGEAASDYAAGDTIIKKAVAGSQISLITDNSGIAMDNEYSVANVLNALAGKLTYSAYATGEKHLTGYVKIADGLTASSKALQTGNIAFSDKDGKGSLAEGTVTPGVTYPEEQVKDSYTQAITGITKDDYIYKQNGVLKEEGKYTFTKDPTKITVEEGSAIDAKADITIDTSKAKLELSGKEAGIKADGHQVSIKGSTVITGKDAISASNGGKVTLNGMTDIKAVGKDGTAISVAGKDSEVAITGNAAASITGAVYVAGGKADITLGDKASTLTGDLSVSEGGQLTLNVTNGAKVTGSYAASDGTLTMNVKDGGYWILKDAENTTSLYATSLADAADRTNAPATGTLIVNGGSDKAHTGYINMTKRTQDLDIANFSGHGTFIMEHKDDGTFTSGNVNIAKAASGSGLTLYTANNGIDMTNKEKVTDTLKAMAKKAIYAEGNDAGKNLTGEVKIGEGLTSSSAKTGSISFKDKTGGLVDGSIKWEPTIEEGDYETFVMKGARSAVTTSFHSWRDNMQDTYTGADLADEDGIFAKALGGKTSSDVSGLKDSNSYWGAQVGYDKALAGGWHTGIAFDYRDGDSDYLLGGKGDNKLYSFGVYGVKKMEDGSYFRVAAKAGRVENEYDVYTELRNKLHADYKANAYGLTAEYGKTFGSEMSYITPKVQLTWSRVGSKDYSGSANNGAIMNIYQDSYDSLVGRLGFEAGMKKAHGSLHAGLYLAHEFNGDIDTRYFAKDGGWKSTSFDGDDTWAELVLGGEYRLGRNSQLYADFARDLGGDFQRKWKLNAGIRLRF